jgi:hypothetical protein
MAIFQTSDISIATAPTMLFLFTGADDARLTASSHDHGYS